MIVPFPTPRRPDPATTGLYRMVEVWFSFWFWWLPQPRHTVVYLDDYRPPQRRKQVNA
jgi:hypothetical protein